MATRAKVELPYLIYVRLSAEEAVRGGMSLQMQEARCREYAQSSGLRVGEVLSDYGFSGKNTRRPGFEAMCERLAEAQGVMTWKLDRLSRRVRDIYVFLERCHREGKEFISVAERFDTTTAVGRGFLGMAAVFAQLEAEQVAERNREGNRHRASKGIWLYQAPFGYTYSRESKLLTPGDRADDCVQVFRDFAATNGNYSATARKLNAQQTGSPAGRGWTAQGTKDVVTNDVYRGRIHYLDVAGKGDWPLIVPADLLAEVDDLLATQRRLPRGRTKQARHPLSGLMACRACASPVIIQLRKPDGTNIMRCRAARHGMGCSQPGVSARRIEQLWLFGLDQAWAEKPVGLDEADLSSLAENQGWVSQEQRERQEASLAAKRARIIELCIEGYVDKPEMQRRLEPIEAELAQLQQAAPPDETPPLVALRRLAEQGIVPARVWPGMAPGERRQLVMSLLRGPLELEVDAGGQLRLYANTWLFAERWESWETEGAGKRGALAENGRLAYAVRARD